MKKTLLTLSLCALMLLGTACNKASNAPESVSIYQKLELSPEQKQELASIRKAQREEMDKVRANLEVKRDKLLATNKDSGISEAQKKAVYEDYKKEAESVRTKMDELRATYDEKFIAILDKKQKKTYTKYIEKRKKEMEKLVDSNK